MSASRTGWRGYGPVSLAINACGPDSQRKTHWCVPAPAAFSAIHSGNKAASAALHPAVSSVAHAPQRVRPSSPRSTLKQNERGIVSGATDSGVEVRSVWRQNARPLAFELSGVLDRGCADAAAPRVQRRGRSPRRHAPELQTVGSGGPRLRPDCACASPARAQLLTRVERLLSSQ
eukprot:scaffold1962_cov241-Pinguiococcus_pyrenoidosus.AAC.7